MNAPHRLAVLSLVFVCACATDGAPSRDAEATATAPGGVSSLDPGSATAHAGGSGRPQARATPSSPGASGVGNGASAEVPPPDPSDPALVRGRFLREMNRSIDAHAAAQRLEARLSYDAAHPLPYLGVDTNLVDGRLVLTAVYADTGAERAGLRKGDVLVSFAGVPMTAKHLLARNVRRQSVGTPVALEIERAGQRMSITATLLARPEEDEDDSEQFPDLVALPSVPAPRLFDFEAEGRDRISAPLPEAFESALGGHGRMGDWRIVGDARGTFLQQADGDTTGIRFPQAIVRDWEAADATVRVRFRYAGGRVDRAAGVILRWQGPNDYYVARANANESDLRIFRVAQGERRTLPGAVVAAPCDDDRWHELVFRAEGDRLIATLDGGPTAEGRDAFFLRGRVGVWTKSDSVTEFDDLKLEATR